MASRTAQRPERPRTRRGSSLNPERRSIVFACLLLASVAAGCAHCPLCGGPWERPPAPAPVRPADWRQATGTVSCPERLAMLPTFELKVMLVARDICGKTGTREILAEQTLKPLAALPASFAFDYDHARLLPTRSYGLEAELWSQDACLFKTDTQYRVCPDGPTARADLVLMREP